MKTTESILVGLVASAIIVFCMIIFGQIWLQADKIIYFNVEKQCIWEEKSEWFNPKGGFKILTCSGESIDTGRGASCSLPIDLCQFLFGSDFKLISAYGLCTDKSSSEYWRNLRGMKTMMNGDV